MKSHNWNRPPVKFLVLTAWASVLLPTATIVSAKEDGDGNPAVAETYRQIHNLVRDGDFEQAAKFMTKAAAADFAGEFLLMAVEVGKNPPEDAAGKKVAAKCRTIVDRYKLGGAVTSDYFEKESFTLEELDSLVESALQKLVAAADANGGRFSAMKEVHAALKPLPEEEIYDYLPLPFLERGHTLNTRLGGHKAVLEIETNYQVFLLGFAKTETGWKWSGYESSERPFPLIENIELQGETLQGEPVRMADYRGKVVLIDFWGTWCAPCIAELPDLKRIHAALREKGFEVIGVALDDEEPLREFLGKNELPWPNIVDADGKIAKRFRVTEFPTTLLIDPDGKHFASNLFGDELLAEIVAQLDLNPRDYAGVLANRGKNQQGGASDWAFEEADADDDGPRLSSRAEGLPQASRRRIGPPAGQAVSATRRRQGRIRFSGGVQTRPKHHRRSLRTTTNEEQEIKGKPE